MLSVDSDVSLIVSFECRYSETTFKGVHQIFKKELPSRWEGDEKMLTGIEGVSEASEGFDDCTC